MVKFSIQEPKDAPSFAYPLFAQVEDSIYCQTESDVEWVCITDCYGPVESGEVDMLCILPPGTTITIVV